MPYKVNINGKGTVTFDNPPSPQDIDEVAKAQGWGADLTQITQTTPTQTTPAQEAQPKQGVLQNIKSDIGKRWGEAVDNAKLLKQGKINVLEYILRNAGQGAGAVTDIPIDIAKPVVQPVLSTGFNALPDKLKTNIVNEINKVSDLYHKLPERARKDIEGAGNIAAVLPIGAGAEVGAEASGQALTKTGAALEKSGQAALEADKMSLAEDIIRPVQTKAIKEAQVARTTETGKGIFKKSIIAPTPLEKSAAEEVAKIPEITAKNTMQQNFNIIRENVAKQAEDLKTAIANNPFIVSRKEVLSKLNSAAENLAEHPLITGDAEKTAKKLINGAKKFVSENAGNGSGLLQARKDYDNWIKTLKPKAFDAKAENAFTIANKAVRNTLNDILDSKATSVAVKDSLHKQSALFTAMDNIAPKAAIEADSAFGRLLQRTGEILGTKNRIVQGLAAAVGIGGLGAAATFAPAAAVVGGTGFLLYKAGRFFVNPKVRVLLGKLMQESGHLLDPGDAELIRGILNKSKGMKAGLSIEDITKSTGKLEEGAALKSTVKEGVDQMRDYVYPGVQKYITKLEKGVKNAATPGVMDRLQKELDIMQGVKTSIEKNREPIIDLQKLAQKLKMLNLIK